MDDTTPAERLDDRDPDGERTGAREAASWSSRVHELQASAAESDDRSASLGSSEDGLLEEGLAQLRREARQAARDDAARDRPAREEEAHTDREALLRERCRALFERWMFAERRRVRDALAAREEQVSQLLGRAGLLLDRFDRLTNQLIRLKARRSTVLQDRESNPDENGRSSLHGLSTRIYLSTIVFLGMVEFFANAPIFSTLLPRNPLTERQIDVIAETSSGWMAGLERVMAQLVLRPDAALLAAGVVTFLCVLAHFFGHSLRALVVRRDQRHGATGSAMENVVPMVLAGLGLILVLGVLFQARVILGDVGERRYEQDMAAVSELRREAGWQRTDGQLLDANQLADQAEDMEQAAARLREYAASMSRMTVPILLLNLTLALAAITAAYFHRRDPREPDFADDVYGQEREAIIETAESTASEISDVLSRARRPIRELDSLAGDGFSHAPEGVARRLESVVTLYRQENARARDLVPERVAAFRESVALGLPTDGMEVGLESFRRAAAEARTEHGDMSQRFQEERDRFNTQLRSWGNDGSDA